MYMQKKKYTVTSDLSVALYENFYAHLSSIKWAGCTALASATWKNFFLLNSTHRPTVFQLNKKINVIQRGWHLTAKLTNLSPSFPDWIGIFSVFVEEGKLKNPEKNPQNNTRTNNKLNPQVMPGPGMEPGSQWWEASTLTTSPSSISIPAWHMTEFSSHVQCVKDTKLTTLHTHTLLYGSPLLVLRWLEYLNDPESYASESICSWWGHPCWTGRRIEVG